MGVMMKGMVDRVYCRYQRVFPPSPVYGSDDEGDGGQADGRGGPLADGQGPLGGAAQQVERAGTHTVYGETGDGHRRKGLPHKGVDHSSSHLGCPPRAVSMSL